MSGVVRIFLYRYGAAALLENYVKALTAAGMEPVVSILLHPLPVVPGCCSPEATTAIRLCMARRMWLAAISTGIGTKKNWRSCADFAARGSRFSASAEAAS